jgi:hypothetical protein
MLANSKAVTLVTALGVVILFGSSWQGMVTT